MEGKVLMIRCSHAGFEKNIEPMKILALEKELLPVDWAQESTILMEEAKSVYQLMLSGNLREIYFTENKHAVLILECNDQLEANQLLSKLPLVQRGLIGFDLMELHPYTGLGRLMHGHA